MFLENKLADYIAAQATHSKDKKVRKKLDAIFSKIQDLLETHSDEESPKTLGIEVVTQYTCRSDGGSRSGADPLVCGREYRPRLKSQHPRLRQDRPDSEPR